MGNNDLDQLTALIARVDPALLSASAVEVKHFFGGAAAYVPYVWRTLGV